MNHEEKVKRLIIRLSKKLPKFSDGRINYETSKIAPVITIFVKFQDKILLLKRSDKVLTYKGKWNTVAGYLDEIKPIEEKAIEEVEEEIGIRRGQIKSINIGRLFVFKDKRINKTWVVTPILGELKEKVEIKLDREHTEYKWINPQDLGKFDIVPMLIKSFKNL